MQPGMGSEAVVALFRTGFYVQHELSFPGNGEADGSQLAFVAECDHAFQLCAGSVLDQVNGVEDGVPALRSGVFDAR